MTALLKSLLYKGGGTKKRLKIFFPYFISLSSHVYDIFRPHELPAQLEVQIASIQRTMLILVSWRMCVRVMALSSYYFNMAPLLAEVTAAAYLFR